MLSRGGKTALIKANGTTPGDSHSQRWLIGGHVLLFTKQRPRPAYLAKYAGRLGRRPMRSGHLLSRDLHARPINDTYRHWWLMKCTVARPYCRVGKRFIVLWQRPLAVSEKCATWRSRLLRGITLTVSAFVTDEQVVFNIWMNVGDFGQLISLLRYGKLVIVLKRHSMLKFCCDCIYKGLNEGLNKERE